MRLLESEGFGVTSVGKAGTLFLFCFPGDVPAEDPDHSSVLGVHARPQAGHLPVALPSHPNGRSGSCAGPVHLNVSDNVSYYKQGLLV